MTAQDCRIRQARADDQARVVALLVANGQSTHAVLAPGSAYFVAEHADGEMVGVLGLELGDRAALLRSAAVLAPWRSRALGAELVRQALAFAEHAGCCDVYCFSTGAGEYWRRFGFEQVAVPEVVSALPAAPQVRHYERLGTLGEEVAWRVRL